uniref:Uncharacterized protein n=1 Tax=Anguilla anguilla TaxID=7936 RepID=A0A0E9TEL9_ANGAN
MVHTERRQQCFLQNN